MSEIQNRLTSLEPYLVQLRFLDGSPVVDMVFKNGWHVPKSEVIQSTKGDSEDVNYHMFYTQEDEIGLDEILDYIDKVISLNIEREKKHALLKVKAKELSDLFRKNPLSKLQGMKFVLGGEKLVQEMKADPMDVVDFIIDDPIIIPEVKAKPQPNPQPLPVTEQVPQQVVQEPNPHQPELDPISQPVPHQPDVSQQTEGQDPNLRYAPNGEVIPPLSPRDDGEIDEDYSKVDLTIDDVPPVRKQVNGKNIDLPPKGNKKPKIELEEFDAPQTIVCKCGPEEVCPACEEAKHGVY